MLGELRPVGGLDRRLREAARLGFTRAIVPRSRTRPDDGAAGVEVIVVGSLAEALRAALADPIAARRGTGLRGAAAPAAVRRRVLGSGALAAVRRRRERIDRGVA